MPIRPVEDMALIAPLFDGWPENLMRSTLDGCMGRAYANDAFTAAQIVNGDFAFLAGDAACPEAIRLAAHVPEDFGLQKMLIVPRDRCWEAVIEAVWGARAHRRERFAIRKDQNHFDRDKLQTFAQSLPEEYRLCPMNGELYREALKAPWSEDFVRSFRDEADFLARGLGVMALKEGVPVAGAASFVVFQGGIEIEIDTREDCRRLGLATACGAALMLMCFERGLYPSWDAHSLISVALAEKLGYVFSHAYPTYAAELDIG